MSSYKLTGMHSERHPFLGDAWSDLPAIAPMDAVSEALAADVQPEPAKKDWSKVLRPLAAGGVTGVVTYATCRAFNVSPKQAKQVAFVIAGLNALVNIASDWIYGEMESLVKTQGTVPVSEAKP